ncbi:hypothetical protein MAPG_07256 [Magnaporthiopsis poae ATCC 64411]|uniref:Uncharacterized protein n=1 Tax=Magnaporthiopsis poae (strain ATCC 64411 / 73-15) TaxID=644358 RepID=A0A0C4E467_MAGP6|nr:hypothetical protein MAPG_07256 [Magnaporthiopsis poae ATCC 64411]
MKFLQLVTVGLAALISGICAAPVTKGEPVITNTELYTKFGGSSMREGTTYKAEIKWPKPDKPDPNEAIEAARKAVCAMHFAYAIVSVKKTTKKGSKTKPTQITMDVEGFLWDLRLGSGGAAVVPPTKTLDTMKKSILGTQVTLGAPTKKSKSQINSIASDYIANHKTFDPKNNNCKSFLNHMMAST